MEINKIVKSLKTQPGGSFIFVYNQEIEIDNLIDSINENFFDKHYQKELNSQEIISDNLTSNIISVDQIRSLKKNFLLKKVENVPSVVFIRNIENVNNNALNASLKILEEFPSNVFFIFGCSSANNILSTIKSRSKVFDIGSRFYSDDIFEIEKNLIEKLPSIPDV